MVSEYGVADGHEQCQEQRKQLEAALLEYVEKYGLTEAARNALGAPDQPEVVCGGAGKYCTGSFLPRLKRDR